MSSLIQSLIDEGALVLYHDYRAGHMQDLSGQGNDGVATNTSWTEGLNFLGTGVVTVADAPVLQLTTGALVALVDMHSQNGNAGRFIAKVDAGGINYELATFSATHVRFYDGVNIRNGPANMVGDHCLSKTHGVVAP